MRAFFCRVLLVAKKTSINPEGRRLLDLLEVLLYWRLATALAGQTRCAWRRSERAELNLLL